MKRQGFACNWLGVLLLTSLIMLSGCSSSMSRIQTWEGEVRETDQVAVLSAPGSIKVAAVNGQPMTNFLIDNMELEYELLPGENQIVFTHKTIWAKAEAVDDGESKVHVVQTPKQVVTINAQPGETYRFDVEKPATRKEAQALIEDFSVNLVDASGQTVAVSSSFANASKQVAANRTPVPDSPSDSEAAGSESAATLDQLKALWGKASEEEKREFLRWAFE